MTTRRSFTGLLGGAAGWPVVARAQQPAMPVVGFLHSTSPDGYTDNFRAFHQGLKDIGCVEGENVTIDQRWAENQTDRLPALAAELVRRQSTVITAGGAPASVAAAKATTTIPIVFISRGPGEAWSCHQPRPPRGQPDRHQFFAA